MSSESTPAKSSEKRKHADAGVPDAVPSAEPKQKKQKKVKQPQADGESQPSGESKEDKKARKAAKKAKTAEPKLDEAPIEPIDVTSEVEQGEAVEASEIKSKEEATSAPAPLEPKKKKARKRNKNNREQTDQDGDAKVGNGTPEEDASLTEQAQKGIQYAWLYKHRHPKSIGEGDAKDDGTYWKFNKARQGWLWKNIWNEELIPKTYVELVIEYLSSMQGQARQKFLSEAQKIVDTPITEPTTEEADQANEEKPEPPTESTQKVEEEESAEVKAQETVSPEKHRRAQLVVEALNSS